MKNLIIVFLSFMLVTSTSEARSKTHKVLKKKGVTKKYKKMVKQNKKNYSFTYDKIWFAQLTSKQQSVYLKTIAKLAVEISKGGGKYSFNDSIINNFFPAAFANEYFNNNVLSNGYIRPKNTSFKDFFENKNNDFGELAPSCPSGQQPCAPYLGLKKGNPPTLVCSKDSTTSCARNGDIELLKNTITKCNEKQFTGGLTQNYCGKLHVETGKVTKSIEENVRKWCRRSSDSTYCKAANRALDTLNGNDAVPPEHEKALAKGNCGKLAAKVVTAKETNRPNNSEAAYNNKFWRDMKKLAEDKRVCPKGVRTDMGVCNVSPDNKKFIQHKGKTYDGNSSSHDEKDKFNACQKRRYNEMKAGIDRVIAGKREDIEILQGKINNLSGPHIRVEAKRRLESKKTKKKEELKKYIESKDINEDGKINEDDFNLTADKSKTSFFVNKKYKNKIYLGPDCSEQVKIESVIGQRGNIDNADLQGLLDQEKNPKKGEKGQSKRERLARMDNLFKSITGLDSNQFRTAFCKGSGESIQKAVRHVKEPRINNQNLQVQAKNSFLSLKKCVKDFKTVEQAGCSFKNTNDSIPANMLKTASNTNPILVQNKTNPDRCRLILDHKKIRVDKQPIQIDNNGDTVKETVNQLTFEKENGVISTRVVPLSDVVSQYNIKIYSCLHDKVPTPTVRQTGGDGPDGDVSSQ